MLSCHSAGLVLLWYSDSDFVTFPGVAKSNALQTTNCKRLQGAAPVK
jgi:hypothetical protein